LRVEYRSRLIPGSHLGKVIVSRSGAKRARKGAGMKKVIVGCLLVSVALLLFLLRPRSVRS
jgi:hypothetical protein